MSALTDWLTGIANAIRAKDGTSAPIAHNTFATRIAAIPAGGASIANGLEITEFDASGNPTKVKVHGDTIWPHAFNSAGGGNSSWDWLTEITAPDLVEIKGNGIIYMPANLSTLTLLCTTLGESAIAYNHMTSITLPELPTVGAYAIYGNNALQSLTLPKCVTTTGTRPMSFNVANTTLTTVQLGSIGYPVTALSASTFNNANSVSLVITIYVTPGSQPLAGSPWSATNATIVYRSAVDGSVL